jgi:hypothetical protein
MHNYVARRFTMIILAAAVAIAASFNIANEFPWKYLGRTKLFAGRYRLFSPEQDSEKVCSTRPIKDGKKLWQLSRMA